MREATMVPPAILAGKPAPEPNSKPTVKRAWMEWIPLAVLPAVCIAFHSVWTSWAFMWLLAAAIFAGCKWQTWWEVQRDGDICNWRRSAAYLLLWPGMDARKFLEPSLKMRRVGKQEWFAAVLKTMAGAVLIIAAKRIVISDHPFWAAWIGMVGLVLFLHFGAFYLIALGWQRIGICAEPIMQRPLASKSLSEFWGKRWNLGFRALSHKLVFRPLQTRYGTVVGTLGAFFVSGLIHDVVISVPARGGYGLPTAYFLVQGLGVLAERSQVGKTLGLGTGVEGRIWTISIAAGPVFFLFHPWFVARVMLPFLRAI
ncbi:MAG TPA: MBOAT family protein [Candidatus Acidoferrales bacterium]|nr:MBOAT family protein [Candidatus Acidoferrales bacterium]